MIDFISSIDNSYQRITIDSDPANRLNNNSKRTYSYDEAVADLNKAVKLFPDFAYAYYNRANLLALSGSLPEAFEDYTKAISLNPAFAEAYYNRGIIQLFMKDTRKGCLDLSESRRTGNHRAYEVLKRYASLITNSTQKNMAETIQRKLNDSPAARWTALLLIASTMFFGYMFVDLMSPLQHDRGTARMDPRRIRHVRQFGVHTQRLRISDPRRHHPRQDGRAVHRPTVGFADVHRRLSE